MFRILALGFYCHSCLIPRCLVVLSDYLLEIGVFFGHGFLNARTHAGWPFGARPIRNRQMERRRVVSETEIWMVRFRSGLPLGQPRNGYGYLKSHRA